MRHHSDFRDGMGRGLLVGALVTAVIMLSFPVVAAVGGNLILGQANSANAVTTLSGAATTNLRITNTQAASPALDLRVAAGSAPLKVNSAVRVANLNADRLDGKHGSAFLLTTGTAANANLLDNLDSTAFAAASHGHDGAYLEIGAAAPDSSLLGGRAPTAYAGAPCAPGATLVGYGRSGPICSTPFGSLTLDSTGNVGQHTSLVLDASGVPVISYYDATNGDLKLVRCGDATCTSDNTITALDGAGENDVGLYTSLVLDADGFPVIAYYDQVYSQLRLMHCGDATCTSRAIAEPDMGNPGDFGYTPSLALDASGFPVISYYDATYGDLMLMHCADAACSTGRSITTVDSAGNVGKYSSLALDASGSPVISYYDNGNDDLKLAHCGNANCSAANTITTVDGAGYVGAFTSLALDAAGFPVIAYYDLALMHLKLVHCGDAVCGTGNNITTVDSNLDMGAYASLVLDAFGSPVISYHGPNWYDADLMLVHCGDATCSAGNTITTVDSAGDVGGFTSLVLDASGHPIIAYYDYTNGDLKLAGATG